MVLVLLCVVLLLGALYALFLRSNNPALSDGRQVTFVVAPGESTAKIAANLKRAGLIDNVTIFRFRLLRSGLTTTLKAGTHKLTAGMDYERIILELRQSPGVPSAKVTIPEGANIDRIAVILQDKIGLSAADFKAYAEAAAPDFVTQYPFLAGAYDDSLEGFLFPDTYQFSVSISAPEVCAQMLARFQSVYGGLPAPAAGAANRDFSPAQYVTIASLVEKEVSVPAERPLVASVIYNRLDRSMKLQLCSTVQFLLPDPSKNKLRLTTEDLATPSPYNTYLNSGLPPGPIANPGKAALQAALNPARTDYLYFVLTGKDGSQTFASTAAEFEAAKAKSKEVFGQ